MPTNDAELLEKVGQMLWGTAWKGPLAEAVRHQRTAVADWAGGRQPVPAGVWSELREVMRRRRHQLDELAPRVETAHDEALARMVKQTTHGR
jgi:hypothetical protein